MSLAQSTHNTYPLYGIDEISIPKNATLIFSHPAVKKNGKKLPLYIYSGALAVQWGYQLITQSTPTIGGEVVQVLSCSAGPMTITGQAAGLAVNKEGTLPEGHKAGWLEEGTQKAWTPHHELAAIMHWFRQYMAAAGTFSFQHQHRDERGILFQYPERGWNFYIQVTGLKGFRYDRDVVAPTWTIQAEIVTDNALDYFEGHTMNSFTDNLLSNVSLLGTIGLSKFAADESTNQAFGQTGGTGSADPFLNPDISSKLISSKNIGDNFQALVAAWSSGDTNFVNGVWSALADTTGNPQNVDAIYTKLFGTSFLGQAGSGVGGTAGGIPIGSTGTAADYTTRAGLAYAISQAFEAVNIPGYVGVAAALQESGMNPDRTQDGCNSANCGIGMWQVNGDGSGRDSSAAVKNAGQNRVYGSTQGNIVKFYPASDQIAAAAKWFASAARTFGVDLSTASDEQLGSFIKYAQGAGDPDYVAHVSAHFGEAKLLISQGALQIANTAAKGLVGTPAAGLRATAVGWATQFVTNSRATYSQGCRRDVENIIPGDYSALPTSDCSNTVALFYAWATGNDHRYGTNGASFNGSTTATMWNSSQEVSAGQAQGADMVIYGANAADSVHVGMLMENYHGDDTPLFSFGSDPPHITTLGNENAYHNARGHATHFFKRLP